MYVDRKKYVLKLKLKSKFNVISDRREMWTSLCNFLCNKLFNRRKIGYQRRSDSSEKIYGKRLKLVDRFLNTNGLVNENSSSLSMLKNKVEISDDEGECCIIAEIPRRKKAWSFGQAEKKPESSLSGGANSKNNVSLSPSNLIKNPVDKRNNSNVEQILRRNSDPNKISKAEKKRFFVSQRVSCNQGKVSKSKLSSKSYLKKKMNYLVESYRLKEKIQYMQLLQSHTTFNLLSVKPALKSIKGPPQPIEVIDLTDENTNEEIEGLKTVRETNSDDQDVQIIKEISGVRSFQDLLKFSPMSSKPGFSELLSIEPKSSSGVRELNCLSKNNLNYLIEDNYCLKSDAEKLEEKLHNFKLIATPALEEAEDESKQCTLSELSTEQEKRIKKALLPHPSDEVLSQGFGLQITRRDMQTLFGLNWLNDEIINFYYSLIVARNESNRNLPKVYAFSTFFYPNLVSSGYSRIRRWTKRVDIFSYDLILVPVHLGMHWCMSIIDFRNKSVRYYDSIGSVNNMCLEKLLSYLQDESLDKRRKTFSTFDWEKVNVDDIPQQMNGADCGVFSCMFAEYLTRDCPISFTQDDMPYFRKKMVIEILDKKLLT